jgi:hypothetical protein
MFIFDGAVADLNLFDQKAHNPDRNVLKFCINNNGKSRIVNRRF